MKYSYFDVSLLELEKENNSARQSDTTAIN